MCAFHYSHCTPQSKLGHTYTNDYSTVWYVLCNGDNRGNMERDGFKFDYRFQEQGIL